MSHTNSIRLIVALGGVLLAMPAEDAGRPDAARLETGRFRYQLRHKGASIGEMEISIGTSEAQQYIFRAESLGENGQAWESVASRAFEPMSASLSLGPPDKRVPEFVLKYDSGRVKGTNFGARRKTGERPIDEAVAAGVVDQRIDWAAVMALDLRPGRTFDFKVFDPGTRVSRIHGEVTGEESVRTGAGSFEVYRLIYQIDKENRVEHYQMLTTRRRPRIMVVEEMPNDLVSELVEVKR